MDIYETLRERRSIRKYKPDQVPDDKLLRILEAARIAPSWSNLQCWKFIVVRDPEKKKQLAASMPASNPAVKAVGETAPVVLVLCADPKESGDQDGKDYYLLDAGLALQQLMLAAHAEGLGTCWVAWFDEAIARAACAVPAGYRVVALTPLGFPEKQPSSRPRKEMDEIVYAEEWGKPL
ncbi:MAG: nitroreductase family protein [Dethiobacteria bacterium]|nr:nitroreductase family protein [Dethiobacteria bacterium]